MNGGAYENQNVDAGQLAFAEFTDGLTNTIALVENATLSEWTVMPMVLSSGQALMMHKM